MNAIVNRRLLNRICSLCQKQRMQTITCRRCSGASCAHLITPTHLCFQCVGQMSRGSAAEKKAVAR